MNASLQITLNNVVQFLRKSRKRLLLKSRKTKYRNKNKTNPAFLLRKSLQDKASYQKHKTKRLKVAKENYQKNKSVISKRNKVWYLKNKPRINQRVKSRLATDINFRLGHNLRIRILQAIKNNSKSNTTLNLLGCSIGELKTHLESKFTSGMNWGNHGFHGWHIDHIRPCAGFDLSDPEQQKQCFHYTNLQPLWAQDNFQKSDKIRV